MQEALRLYCEAEELSRDLGDLQSLQARLGDHAELLMLQGEIAAALPLLEEMAQLAIRLGNMASWARAQLMRANALSIREQDEEAINLLREIIDGLHDIQDANALGTAFFSLATLLFMRGEIGETDSLLTQAEHHFVVAGKSQKLEDCRSLRAAIARQSGTPSRSQKEAEELAVRAASAARQAHALYMERDLEGARKLAEEEVDAMRKLGSKDGLKAAIGFLGAVLHEQNDLSGAMICFTEKEQLCRELGNREQLLACLNSRANIFLASDDFENALTVSIEQQQIAYEEQDESCLTSAVQRQTQILKRQGKDEDMLMAFITGLSQRVSLARRRGDLLRALSDIELLIKTCRELKNRQWLCWGLFNHADILQEKGDLASALAVADELESVVRESTENDALVDGLLMLARLFSQNLGRPRQAVIQLEEALRLVVHDGEGKAKEIEDMLAYLRSEFRY